MLSTGAGESIGPILSSVLYDQFGFREAADIFAFIIIVYGLIYFFFCGNYRMFMMHENARHLTSPASQKHVAFEEELDAENNEAA